MVWNPGYRIALVSGPTRGYLWVLARRPDPPRAEVERLLRRAAELGFDTAELLHVSPTVARSEAARVMFVAKGRPLGFDRWRRRT